MAQPSPLTSFFAELIRFGQNGEYDRALKSANKILKEAPEDVKAFHCKIVCLIHLSQFEEALKTIDKNLKLSEGLTFERAYCLYRLNRVTEAWTLLQSVENPNFQINELKAQVLYRLEKYEDCFDTYRDLIKNSEDDYEDERETNLAAVIASLSSEQGKQVKNAPQIREETYEMCYNVACVLLGQKKYAEAISKLQAAEELCRKTLEDEDTAEEEIEEELGVIRTQRGYALQMLMKNEEALKLYNKVLKVRPSDVAVTAIASNNVVTINKDQNVFDSKKRIKAATSEGLEYKLNSSQQRSIALNHSLLLLHTNQVEQCKKQVELMKKNFPDANSEATLIEAALFSREKQMQKATALLKKYSKDNPEQSLSISFTLVQLLLSQGHIGQACEVLKSLGDVSQKPGVISALVMLYLNEDDKDAASSVLTNSIAWYRENQPNDPHLSTLVRASANFHLQNGDAKVAATFLDELRKANPNDSKTLAQLISAYSKFDPKKARDISKSLPSVGEMTAKIDVDSLESTTWTMGAKYVRKAGKAEPSPASHSDDNTLQKRKKKHRKGKLPKNYDPTVDPDPERWLPKRERSTFKKRKDRRGGGGIGKGTQGAVGGTTDLDAAKKPEASPRPGAANPSPGAATQSSPNPQLGPRQQKMQAMQKKKKKKGGRW